LNHKKFSEDLTNIIESGIEDLLESSGFKVKKKDSDLAKENQELKVKLFDMEQQLASLSNKLKESVFNCPSCGRHDYGLLAAAGAVCKAEHEGYKARAEAAEKVAEEQSLELLKLRNKLSDLVKSFDQILF
jgi:hypothetical protein